MAGQRRSTRAAPGTVRATAPSVAAGVADFEDSSHAGLRRGEVPSIVGSCKMAPPGAVRCERAVQKKGKAEVFKERVIKFFVQSTLNFIGAIRSLIFLVVIGSIGHFGFLMVTNEMDVELSLNGVRAFWLSAWDYTGQAWVWITAVWPL